MFQLSQKERMLLEDEKTQEEICMKKYKSYAKQASDPGLSKLFNKLAGEEQKHYDTINQLLNGQTPNLSQQGKGQQEKIQQMQQESQIIKQQSNNMPNNEDKQLVNDLLSTEKYVASTYSTAVFESPNPVVRQALQHIQEDEQDHGWQLFEYMQNNGMYDVK